MLEGFHLQNNIISVHDLRVYTKINISRAWYKTIVTTSFYTRSNNSFALSPRYSVCCFYDCVSAVTVLLFEQAGLDTAAESTLQQGEQDHRRGSPVQARHCWGLFTLLLNYMCYMFLLKILHC